MMMECAMTVLNEISSHSQKVLLPAFNNQSYVQCGQYIILVHKSK